MSLTPTQGQGNSHSDGPSVSANGRVIAFQSLATNLFVGDPNGTSDVFVRDRENGTTLCVSVALNGIPAAGMSLAPSLSGDGRFVAFWSLAPDLVTGDTNLLDDVFVRDLQNSVTTRVSVASNGAEGDGKSFLPAISSDGRYVAFESNSTNLVAADNNGVFDVFVHDTTTLLTERVSVGPAGVEGNGSSYRAAFSADTRFVGFVSKATNFAVGDSNGQPDVFLRDRQNATTVRVSVSSAGAQADGDSAFPAVSSDGRFVAFQSLATNLVSGDNNGAGDIFLRDVQLGITTRISVDTNGLDGSGPSENPSISDDGQWVVFYSEATDLIAGDTNARSDIFLRDLAAGQTTCISATPAGFPANNHSFRGTISSGGRFVAFNSQASNLVAGDTNGVRDVFLRDLLPNPRVYCTAGTTTHGCLPAISSSGIPSASAGSGLDIAVNFVEGQKNGIFFYGINGRLAAPWAPSSTSLLCVKPPTQRMGTLNSGGTPNLCDGTFSTDFLVYMSATPGALGQPLTIGQRFNLQCWFRDPPAQHTTNLSDALEFDIVP